MAGTPSTYIYMYVCICVRVRTWSSPQPTVPPSPWRLPSHEARTPLEITDFMGHLRRLMKELYEAGFFCFKASVVSGPVDNFRITTRHFPTSPPLILSSRFSSPQD